MKTKDSLGESRCSCVNQLKHNFQKLLHETFLRTNSSEEDLLYINIELLDVQCCPREKGIHVRIKCTGVV